MWSEVGGEDTLWGGKMYESHGMSGNEAEGQKRCGCVAEGKKTHDNWAMMPEGMGKGAKVRICGGHEGT